VESSSPTGASALLAASEVVAVRRAALVQRLALAAHDVVVSEGVGFADVRPAAEAAVEAVEAALAGSYASRAVSALNRDVLRAIDAGVSLGLLVAAVQAGFGALVGAVAEVDARVVPAVARVGSAIASEVSGTAARSLEERSRSARRHRFERADRFREAAGEIAATALDAERALGTLAAATARTLDCDWAAVAFPEDDGRLVITALEGRGAGWAQRWTLRVDDGFCARALIAGSAVATGAADLAAYAGADRPAAVVAVRLRRGAPAAPGVLFAGRDHGPIPDEDEVQLAAGLADVGARALGSARLYADAKRAGRQAAVLIEAITMAAGGDGHGALAVAARAGAEVTGADLAMIRIVDERAGDLVTRGVYARSTALAAELEGMRVRADAAAAAPLLSGLELVDDALSEDAAARRIEDRLGTVASIGLPITVGGVPIGGLVLARSGARAFGGAEIDDARGAAAHAAVLVELERLRGRLSAGAVTAVEGLERLGEALTAGNDEARTARFVVRLASEAVGARRAILHLGSRPDELVPVAGFGVRHEELAGAPGRSAARAALGGREPVLERVAGGGSGSWAAVSVPLLYADAPVGVLQVFTGEEALSPQAIPALAAFAPRAGEALFEAAEARRRQEDLRRLDALVEIAAQATAGASLGGTLTAVGGHVATFAPGAQAGVFIVDEGRIAHAEPAALASGPQGAAVAALLREAGGDPVLVQDVAAHPRLAPLAPELAGAGVEGVLVVPLRFREEVIGAIALLSGDRDRLGPRQVALLRRQVPPIALAIQSALLAGQGVRLEHDLSAALRSERAARAELAAHTVLSRALVEGWERDRAVRSLAQVVAELVGADAAALVAADALGAGVLETVHVASPLLEQAVRPIVRPGPVLLPPAVAERLAGGRTAVLPGGAIAEAGLLPGPLRAPGSTVGLVPLLTGDTLTAVVAVVSLDPERPIDEARLEPLTRYAPQAAFALRRPRPAEPRASG
jgi:GAF domain-containing protein